MWTPVFVVVWLDVGHPPWHAGGWLASFGGILGSGEGRFMSGIQFLTDEKGHKTAAVIDLKVHKALWEDVQDVLVSKARRAERGVPLAKVKAGLVASGKLRG